MVASLLVLQVVSVVLLWTLNALDEASEGTFALFLAIDLVSFALISYSYRTTREGAGPKVIWVVAGSALVVILALASLFLA